MRRHVHGLQEAQRVLLLLLLAAVAPSKLLLHHVKHSWQGLTVCVSECKCLGVDVRTAHANNPIHAFM
jgi:hypothetical protein